MPETLISDHLETSLRQTRSGIALWTLGLVATAVGVIVFQITHIAQYLAGDSFTYFVMARKLYETGLWYSYSGLDHTTGVHPAYYFITIVLYPLFGMHLPAWSMVCNGAFLAGGLYLCYRAFGLTVATVMFFLSVIAPGVGVTNNGMESSVLFLVLSGVAYFTTRMDATTPTRRQLFALGCSLGLAVFARLDTIFFVAAFLAVFLLREWLKPDLSGATFRRVLVHGVTVGLPILFWLAVIFFLNLRYDGTLIPLSGRLKSSLPHLKDGFSLGSLLVLKLFIASVVVTAVYVARRVYMKKSLGLLVPSLAIGTTALFLYNALFASGIGVWYGTLPFFALALTLGLIVRELAPRCSQRVYAAAFLVAVGAVVVSHALVQAKPDILTLNQEASAYLLAHHSVGSAVGELNDGIFAFYGGEIPVYNLTGLGNNAVYANALRAGTLAEYFKSKHIEYVVGGDSGIQVPGAKNGLACTKPWYVHGVVTIYLVEDCVITEAITKW